MRLQDLPFAPPLIGEEEISEVIDTLRSDWITTGPKVKRFEREFAAYLGAPVALAVNSCTAALHLALLALGIQPGEGVITTPLTFCSGIHVIEHVGARPVLVDVEPQTLNLDPAKVTAALAGLDRRRANRKAPRDGGPVKAIMPVHLYGHPCQLDELLEIARRRQLAMIEDAAHALPAKYKGRFIGNLSDSAGVPLLTAFSFYATKNMTTAEGGMLTGPPELVDVARLLSLHGMSRDAWKRYSSEGSWYYEVVRPGFKYNMTDIQAAIGLVQLRKLSGFHARRREIVGRYNQAFAAMPELEAPPERAEVEHAWHLYVLRLRTERLSLSRHQFIEELKVRRIATSVHFIPVHLHPYYRDKYGYRPHDFPVAYDAYQRMISLPLAPRMTDDDVEDVIEAVRDVVAKHRTVCTVAVRPKLRSQSVVPGPCTYAPRL
ncbi:MAG TPA: DegT/DnrJ/EryC1/StrS aminotransferase family protein [Terriglobia bacterium]|nr:DegT/DnrJ/EryC1/StrS aminotransferase family protein [Terriglobia bacterium]